MSVNAYTYGTAVGIHRHIGWVIGGREMFAPDTTPSMSQVEDSLDQIASVIHAKMYEAGYVVATEAVVTSSAPRALNWLIRLNEAGAAAEILHMFPVSNDPETGDANPEKYYRTTFENGLKLISGRFLELAGLTRSPGLSDGLVCTSILDGNGNEKAPMFTREKFSYVDAEEEG